MSKKMLYAIFGLLLALFPLPSTASARLPIHIAPIVDHDSIPALARQVLEQAPPRFCLAGLSMGGIVAMEIYRQSPDRIERLALMDTNPLAETPLVRDLVSLTLALQQPADRLAWLSVLRAQLVGLDLADIDRLAGGEVLRLADIVLQVVELPLVHVIIEMSKLELLGDDSVMTFDHMHRRVFIVVIINGISVPFFIISRKQRNETFALHIVRRRNAGRFQQGLGEVQVLYHLIGDGLGLRYAGPSNQ